MTTKNFLSKIRGLFSASQSTDVSLDCRLTVGSPSFHRRSTMLKLVSVLVLILTIGSGNAWGTDIVINLNLKQAATYPDGFPTSSGTSSGTYTFGGYSFGFSCNTAVYRGGSANNYYILIGKAGATSSNASVITFPAIANYKLTEVVLTVATTSGTNVKAYIGSTYGTAITGGSEWTFNNSSSGNANVHTWTLSSTSANTAYKMYIVRASGNNTYNGQLAGLKLTYEPVGGGCSDPASALAVSASPSTIYTSGTSTLSVGSTGNGSTVTYSVTSDNSAYASIVGTTFSATRPGTYTVQASQDEDGGVCGGTATVDITVRYQIKWSVNGDDSYNAGSPTTYIEEHNGKIATFPTSPASAACDGSKEFVGWTATPIVGTTNTKPTFVTPQTQITGNTTLYAVFATRTANSYSPGDINDLINGKNVIIYNANRSKAMASSIQATGKLNGLSVTFNSTDISSPDAALIWTVYNSGTKYIFKSGNNYLRVTSNSANTKLTCDGTSDTWIITEASTGVYNLYSTAGSSTYKLEAYVSGTTYFFTSYNGSGNDYKMKFYVPTYTAYATTCCTPLGSINGSVNMSSSTDGTVTISGWTYNAGSTGTTESNVSSYTVKLYKWNGSAWAIANANSTTGGSSGTAATRTGIATDSKSVTYSGLEYGGTYKFTVQPIGNGSSYCDGEETAVTSINGNSLTDNKFINKYSIYIDDATDANYAHNYITSISSHAGSVDITLLANKDYYQYKLSLGGVVWWGNTGKMTSANCSSWTFTAGASNCKLQTNLGGTYTFALAAGTPAISVTYPPDDQASGKNIYFDNSILEWSDIFYRVGSGSTNVKEDFTLVAGTDNFYYTTTPEKSDISAWHIANNTGWTGSNDIYKTKTGDDYAITKSIAFQQYVVTGHMTIIPTTTSSKGSEDKNNNCDFYTINTPTSGMLTHTATITAPSHGTITISNTDQSLSATSTTANLPHRTILTITATPATGYTCTALTVNGAAFTSGSTHILAADATIAATFTANTYDVTLEPTSQTGSVADQVVQATYDAAMPTTVKAAGTAIVIPERTGYSFTGWFDNSIGGKQYYQYTGSPKTLSSANAWDKTSATNLYAQWSINSYTLTWATVRGKVTTAGTGADVNAIGNVSSSQEYNTALTAPVCGNANGYTFTGWSPDVADNMPAANTTYTAQWSANVYTVTLDNQSATTAGAASVSATFGQAMPSIASNLPAKTGYRFDGYYTAKNGGGTKYYNADGSSATNMAMYGANPKLYANWVAQITFSVNGVVDDDLTCDVTASLPSSADVPTACGDCWAFAGWDASSTCSTTPGHAGGENAATHGITTPTTLYAVYGQAVFEWISSTSGLVDNDYYVLTNIASSKEYALSNTANPSYSNDAASTDVTDKVKENAEGYYIYNPAANNIWKFTGTSSSGQLYNAASAKYLNLSGSGSILSTTNNLTFTLGSNGEWKINSTKYLRHYSANDWDATASLSEGKFSCYLYHQTSATYATEPSCETYDIVWKVDGTPLSTGSQTVETNTCAGIEELPEDPDDDALDCATKFVGWSEGELVGVGHDAPADLFTSVGYAPAIEEDKTFHAVFATTVGTPIAATEDTEFSSTDESGGYGSATYSFKAANKYLQKQSIWTSSNMTNVKVKIRVYHFSNSKADVLRVSLINSSGTEVVGADLSTSHFGSNISGGGYSDYVELTPTTAVTGYKVSMKTLNSNGTGISKIEREVVASGFKDYVTMCCDHIVTLSDGSPSNGSVTFDPVGPIETCTAAKEVSMTITPDPGYYLSAWTSSGVTPTSVDPAITTNNANAQTTTVTFAKETTEGTYTAGATFSAKALEGWTWMYKKDADAADDAVDPYAIPDVVEIYKDQYARFIITGYTPVDVIAAKQGYVYNNDSDPKEPQYDRDLLAYVSKNGSAPWQYFQLRGKAPTESTTITFKAVGDASITKTVTIRVKALPLAHFVDNVHNVDFDDVVATVTTGVVTLTKQTPTHDDYDSSTLNTCEETHSHLVGWIDGDWSPYAAYMAGTGEKPTISAIIGATGYFYAPGVDIDLVAKDGKTYYAVWAKVE